MPKTNRFFFVMFLVLVALQSGAQDGEAPCTPVEETLLASLEGDWDVEWSYRTAPGEFAESIARSHIERDLLGCALVEHFEGTLRGIDYRAMTIFSQPEEGVFDRVRVDSEHGGFTQSSGRLEDGVLVFEWQRPLTNRLLRTRHYFKEITETSFVVEFQVSHREESPFEVVQRAQYRKRK